MVIELLKEHWKELLGCIISFGSLIGVMLYVLNNTKFEPSNMANPVNIWVGIIPVFLIVGIMIFIGGVGPGLDIKGENRK